MVEEAPEGGYTARALGASIFTEADTLPELHAQLRDAARCQFDEGRRPGMVTVHIPTLRHSRGVAGWVAIPIKVSSRA